MNRWFMMMGVLWLSVSFSAYSFAGDATPQEVIQKVNEAIEYISKNGDKVLPEFNDINGKWAWGGTYVFIMKCENTALATHPVSPKLIGRDLSSLKDQNGNYFFSQMCEVAKNPKGGWIEYLWPKPGEEKPSRKISFCKSIPGMPYQPGAGIYDNTISIEELNKLLK
ncbi:MAG: cache domain-containing protein [Desulfobacterales bacterium]|nr:cache domain-containing protein [Desulfobacterales bacterium]